jgi:hypothetical protein
MPSLILVLMTEVEGWIMHGSEAVNQVTENQTVEKQFNEAIRVMKMEQYEHVTEQN